MGKQQLGALFVCNFVIFTGVSALVSLMPVYLKQLGADSSVTGFFMAALSLGMALSNVAAGQLSDRIQLRKPFLIVGGLLAAPITLMMTGVTSVPVLAVLMCGLWFVTGIAMTMVNILVGLISEAGQRGRYFGILSLSVGCGVFFGAFFNGRIVDRWGYEALFALLAAFYLVIPAAALLVEDKKIARMSRQAGATALRSVFANRTFRFLLGASVLAQAANSLIFLSRPLIMDSLNFDATAITSAGAFGNLLTLPLPLVIGWLADRVGRKPLLIFCFLATTLALVGLAGAVDLWHFWVASAFATILGLSTIVGSAMVTDMFPKETLGTSLSILNVTPWVGIVFGLSAGGMAISAFQMIPTLLAAALLSIGATLLLLPISARKPIAQTEAA
jgi:MFS family permease